MRRSPARRIAASALIATIATAALAAPGEVEVVFRAPERFADVQREGPRARAEIDDLGAYLRRRAARAVPPDVRLIVTITDLQRAGWLRPSIREPGEDIRIVRDGQPSARIELEFQLVDARGAVLKEGRRTLRDTGFRDEALVHRGEPLGQEKTLLDRWLDGELGRGRSMPPP